MICVFEDGPLQGKIEQREDCTQEIICSVLEDPIYTYFGYGTLPVETLNIKTIVYRCYGEDILNGEKVKVFDVYTTK